MTHLDEGLKCLNCNWINEAEAHKCENCDDSAALIAVEFNAWYSEWTTKEVIQ